MRSLNRFVQNVRGALTVEFALIAPVLVILLLGLVDLSRFILLHQKVDRVASTVSDLVARKETIAETDFLQIYEAARLVAEPFDLNANGGIIISSVNNNEDEGLIIKWQRIGGGNVPGTSEIGSEGDTPNLPAEFVLSMNDTVIIAESNYQFEALFLSPVISPVAVKRTAYFRPRLGTLTSVAPG